MRSIITLLFASLAAHSVVAGPIGSTLPRAANDDTSDDCLLSTRSTDGSDCPPKSPYTNDTNSLSPDTRRLHEEMWVAVTIVYKKKLIPKGFTLQNMYLVRAPLYTDRAEGRVEAFRKATFPFLNKIGRLVEVAPRRWSWGVNDASMRKGYQTFDWNAIKDPKFKVDQAEESARAYGKSLKGGPATPSTLHFEKPTADRNPGPDDQIYYVFKLVPTYQDQNSVPEVFVYVGIDDGKPYAPKS